MNNTPTNRTPSGKKKKGIGLYILIMLVLIGTLIATLGGFGDDEEQPSYDEILGYFRDSEVTEFTIDGIDLEAKLKDGKVVYYRLPSIGVFLEDAGEWIERDRNAGTLKQNYVVETVSWWASMLPYLLIIGVFIIFWIIMMNRQDGGAKGAMNFEIGRAHV